MKQMFDPPIFPTVSGAGLAYSVLIRLVGYGALACLLLYYSVSRLETGVVSDPGPCIIGLLVYIAYQCRKIANRGKS